MEKCLTKVKYNFRNICENKEKLKSAVTELGLKKMTQRQRDKWFEKSMKIRIENETIEIKRKG